MMKDSTSTSASASASASATRVRYAFYIWLAALAVLLSWLVTTLSGGGGRYAAMVAQDAASGPPSASPTATAGSEASGLSGAGGQVAPADPGYILENLPPEGSLAAPVPPFAPEQNLVLVGFGLQGMYQTTDNTAAWTLSTPGPVLAAQVIKRGPGPQIVTSGIRLAWEREPETGTPDKEALRGEMLPDADGLSFAAAIPVSARQADGRINPYPLITLIATDADSGAELARSAAVLAVSPGYGCAHCHADNGKAILEVHDRHQKTTLQDMAAKGPVDCRTCHGPADGPPGSPPQDSPDGSPGGSPDNASGKDADHSGRVAGLSVSAAIHGWHAPYLADRAGDACLSCHIGLGRSPEDSASRPRPLFARSMHIERGLSCVNCHGVMENHALALLTAENSAPDSPAAAAMARITPRPPVKDGKITPRLPWKQQPDCTGCHDFARKPRLETASGFNHWTDDAAGLFSRRLENMGVLRCPACHGAPHALYPARNPLGGDRDNLAPLQYQELPRPLGAVGNCALCHNEPMDYSAHHDLVERSRTVIHLPAGVEPVLPVVRFSHQAHDREDCRTCHHTGREDGVSLLCTSAGCHDQPKAATDGADPLFFRNAFHGGHPSCLACHTTNQDKGLPAGPTDCKACHAAPSPRWAAEAAARGQKDR